LADSFGDSSFGFADLLSFKILYFSNGTIQQISSETVRLPSNPNFLPGNE
jgi:hypothetical protein